MYHTQETAWLSLLPPTAPVPWTRRCADQGGWSVSWRWGCLGLQLEQECCVQGESRCTYEMHIKEIGICLLCVNVYVCVMRKNWRCLGPQLEQECCVQGEARCTYELHIRG